MLANSGAIGGSARFPISNQVGVLEFSAINWIILQLALLISDQKSLYYWAAGEIFHLVPSCR